MRPAIAIFCVIVVGVGLAALVSVRTPHPDPLPADVEKAREDAANPPPKDTKPNEKVDVEGQFAKVKEGAIRASLEIKDRGILELELYPKAAPKTVAHIAALAAKNFYSDLKVHREEASVIQMGDPESKDTKPDEFELKGIGSHGSGSTVPLEVADRLPNVQYTVGLARTNDPDSGDSQIYINKQDNPGFNYAYCVFGRVVHGTDIIDKIKKGDVIKHLQVYTVK